MLPRDGWHDKEQEEQTGHGMEAESCPPLREGMEIGELPGFIQLGGL